MSYSLKDKKILFNNLAHLLQQADAISIPIDTEITKTKVLEQIAIALTGNAVLVQLLMEKLQIEIAEEEEKAAQDRIFKKLFEEEQSRYKRPGAAQKPPPAPEDDDIGEEFEQGM